jgi:hypothetical protein
MVRTYERNPNRHSSTFVLSYEHVEMRQRPATNGSVGLTIRNRFKGTRNGVKSKVAFTGDTGSALVAPVPPAVVREGYFCFRGARDVGNIT